MPRARVPGTHRRYGGVFIVMVGPDGVGKTTAASTVGELYPGTSRYFHFRPPASGGLMLLSDLDRDGPPMEKNNDPVWPPLGWARLAVAFVRFWWGYLATVRPALRQGDLVIGDRWAYPYLVQPRAVRFGGPERLARSACATTAA